MKIMLLLIDLNTWGGGLDATLMVKAESLPYLMHLKTLVFYLYWLGFGLC